MATILTFPARQPRAAGATPTRASFVLAPEVREHIEHAVEAALDTVERLVAILDRADGDPDAEDGGDDEPSLGAPESNPSQIIWLRDGDRDLETAAITREKHS